MANLPSKPNQDKVLMFLPWAFDLLGGVDVVVDRIWREIEKRHPKKCLIGIQDWVRSGIEQDSGGRQILYVNMPECPSEGVLNRFRYLVTFLRKAPSLLSSLKDNGIRTVNFHFPTLNAFPLALLRLLGLWDGKIVLSFHGSDVKMVNPDSFAWRLIASQTDSIVACSGFLKSEILQLRIFRDKPVSLVYNGIDVDKFIEGVAAGYPKVKTPYILNVGSYVEQKGQDFLIRAFRGLSEIHPNVKLVFVGAAHNGIWLLNLKELVRTLELCERVIFFENLSQAEVGALMSNAECLAHSSLRESFPLVLLEAAVFKVPVVATRVGGIPELIDGTGLGWIVEPKNVAELSNALLDVFSDIDHARQVGSNLHERIRDRFSAAGMASSYEKLFA